MNKKNDFIIDVISEIDDEIVDKALTKRFKLWAKKGKSKISRFVPVMAAAACACIIFGVLLYILLGKGPATSPGTSPDVTPDGKQIPIYKGMTVSNEAPPSADSAYFDFENAELEFLSAPLYEQDRVIFINDETDSDNADDSTTDSNPSENNGSSEDSTAPEVFGGTYYALKNEDIYIHVHLSNPDEFEILSFTLNGKKYSSNMFEYGSDLERLILKYNVGDVDGLQEYTIDAIKYVDGDKIKDVRMDGDRTVKVHVNDENQAIDFGAQLVGFDLMINPTWKNDFEGEKVITSLSLWEGSEKLRDLDPSATMIDLLPSGKRLILKATYKNGETEETAQYIFDSRSQSEGLSVTDGIITGLGTCSDTVLYIDMPVAAEAFMYIKYVKEIYFGSGATYLDRMAFYNSNSIEKIVFSYGIETIGEEAFSCCSNLETVIFSDSLRTISAGAFSGCENITEIIIPKSVETLENSAFGECHPQSVRIENPNIKILPTVIKHDIGPISEVDYFYVYTYCTDTFRGCTVIYFAGTIEEWKAATPEVNGILCVANPVAVHCSDGNFEITDILYETTYQITSITIPANVIRIEPWAFEPFQYTLQTIHFEGTYEQFRDIGGKNALQMGIFRENNVTVYCTNAYYTCSDKKVNYY